MKKYLITVITCLMLFCTFQYFYYYRGSLYINFDSTIETISTKNQKTLYLNNEPYQIKGVNISMAKPGAFPNEFAITKQEYLIWLKQIQQMNANTIQLYQIANPDFYEALYEFNQENETPLYVIQGIEVDETIMQTHLNALEPSMMDAVQKQIHAAIDVVHGRHKTRKANTMKPEKYTYDISQWVYSYSIGSAWDEDLIVYTNENIPQESQYQGDYVYTKQANNFEIFLAKMADQLIDYETSKYSQQKAITFTISANTTPLDLEEKIKIATNTFAKVDMEHLYSTPEYQSTLYASYPAYAATQEIYDTYSEYLTILNQHHTYPVVISEFGASSSRGQTAAETDSQQPRNAGNLTEAEQGQAIISMYEEIVQSGCAGGLINNWQDEWYKTSWNVKNPEDEKQNADWHDLQSANQSYGLMSFDAGKKHKICYVDGKTNDWKKVKKVIKNKEYTVAMQNDLEALYILVEKKTDNDAPLYIPLDITNESGSKTIKELNLKTSKPTDFVIEIHGENESKLWVQSRYNANKTLYGNLLQFNYDPYFDAPKKNDSHFEVETMTLSEKIYYQDHQPVELEDFIFSGSSKNYILYETFPTGNMQHGNNNPKSKDYHSLADFFIEKDTIEIRIPWTMLNVSDPIAQTIHDDYYKNSGISSKPYNKMYIGIGTNQKTIDMKPFKMNAMDLNPEYHERLKQSYSIVQEYWK